MTGATGFIGSNLFERLAEVGEVRGLDDLSTGYLRNIEGMNRDFIEGSILNEAILKKAVHGCNAIVHLAARPSVPCSLAESQKSHEANATGTVRVFDAARSLNEPIVIAASSSFVYGANPILPKCETAVADKPICS